MGLQPKHPTSVQLRRPVQVGVGVHGALGSAGGAGRVQPKRRLVPVGIGSGVGRRVGVQPGIEGVQGHAAGLCGVGAAAADDDAVHLVPALLQRLRQRRQQRRRHQRGLRTRMAQLVGVVVGGQQRVDGHRHHPGVQTAQKRHHPVAAVMHQQQHAFFAPQAQRAQGLGAAAHPLVQRAVAQFADVVDQGRAFGVGGVARQQVRGEIEAFRRGRRQGGWHRVVSSGSGGVGSRLQHGAVHGQRLRL